MKRIILAAIMATFGSVAFAADNDAPFTGNVLITADANGCIMLAENVTLGVSGNVHGMWQCDEANNVIKVGACHEGGSRKPGTCSMLPGPDGLLGAPNDADDHWNYTGCTTEGDAAPAGTAPDYNGYIVGSAGGSVSAAPLSGRCDGTTLSGLDYFQ